MAMMKRAADDRLTNPDGAKKPVFLTKAQREQLALQKREEEVTEQKRRAEQLLLQTNHPSSTDGPKPSSDRDRERDKDKNRERERDREREHHERRERDRKREWERERDYRDSELRNREREEEQKARGQKTSRDMNILYQNPHEAKLLFGRDFRAGRWNRFGEEET